MKLLPTKICTVCGKEKSETEFYLLRKGSDQRAQRCRDCDGKATYASRKKRWDDALAYQREWRQAGGGEHEHSKRRELYANLRAEFIREYGGECSCRGCHEFHPEFLTMEHEAHDGKQHRKDTGSSLACYKDLKKRGWPKDEGHCILCMNCNWATRFGAVCPHVRGEVH